MAEVNNEQGFTRIANKLLENIFLYSLKKVDLAVIFLTIRYTWGYQREHSGISINQLKSHIKTDRANISRSLQKLIDSNIIKVIAEEDNLHPRILKFNRDFDTWDECRLKGEEFKQSAASEDISHIAVSVQGVLSDLQPRELSDLQPHIYIKKEEKKIKEIGSIIINNIIYLISEEEIKNNNTATALNELNERLTELYISCFSYEPNVYELEAVKNEVFCDDRFETLEKLKVIQESFHKAATYPSAKRNTNYVIKVIQSKKQELFLKREQEKKMQEKLSSYSQQKKQEYIPGSILGPYEKEMAERKKQIKKENQTKN